MCNIISEDNRNNNWWPTKPSSTEGIYTQAGTSLHMVPHPRPIRDLLHSKILQISVLNFFLSNESKRINSAVGPKSYGVEMDSLKA